MSKVAEQLRAYMGEYGASLHKISQAVGYSPATLSRFLNGQYQGDVKKVEKAVGQYLRMMRIRMERKFEDVKFVHTGVARRIFEALDMTHMEHGFAVIVGDSGVGKTMALREYARDRSDVIYVHLDPCRKGRASFLMLLVSALGGDVKKRSCDLFDQCVDKLKDSHKLMILDEAEHLNPEALDTVRLIRDITGIGLVIVGIGEVVIPKLRDNRLCRRVYKRVTLFVNLEKPEAGEIREIVEQMGLPEDAEIEVVKLARRDPRTAVLLAQRALRLAEINRRKADEGVVRRAMELLVF